MASTSILSDELASQMDTPHTEKSEWTAWADGGATVYRWKLDPNRAFGRSDAAHWVGRLVQAHGFPLRLQWRQGWDGGGALLYEASVWQAGDGTQEGGMVAMMPQVGGADVDHQASNGFERAVIMVMERPGQFAAALQTIMEGLRSNTTARDAILINTALDRHSKAQQSIIASQVEATLHRMAVAGGYDDQDDQDDDDQARMEGGHTADSIHRQLSAEAARDKAELDFETARVALAEAQLAAAPVEVEVLADGTERLRESASTESPESEVA